jgi:dihydrofolate reductase
MTMLIVDITMSLDGFIAGPNRTVEHPLGEGGDKLHDWIIGLASWREPHGLTGGTRNADDDLFREYVDAQGAVLMGRRMFSGGEGPWEDDPVADGWWGDEPPFHAPVFILTHHARETVTKSDSSYTFVTDGLEAALDRARAAAGERNVAIAGGADVVQQYLRAGLVDEIQIHVAPLLLGDGVRLLDNLDESVKLEGTRVIESPAVTHLKYRVVK